MRPEDRTDVRDSAVTKAGRYYSGPYGVVKWFAVWGPVGAVIAVVPGVLMSVGLACHPEAVAFCAVTFFGVSLVLLVLAVVFEGGAAVLFRWRHRDLLPAFDRDCPDARREALERVQRDPVLSFMYRNGIRIGLVCLGAWIAACTAVCAGALYFEWGWAVGILQAFS